MKRSIGRRDGLALLAALVWLGACGGQESASDGKAGNDEAAAARGAPVPVPPATAARDLARLSVGGFGEIAVELLPELAPETVASFVRLAEQGFYDGTTFHRVIPDFMIQGGDPNSKNRDPRDDGTGGPGYYLEDEFSDVSLVRGIVAMANQGFPGTGGSQFFVMVGDRRDLDGRYAVFGHVVSGMDVADAIATTPRDVYGRHGPRDRPLEDVQITGVTVERGAGGAPGAKEGSSAEGIGSGEWDEGAT